MKNRIITVVNQKGGVAKTTTAVNLATAFAAVDQRVLLLDLDPQGNASTGLGINTDQRHINIYDVLLGNQNIESAIIETVVPNLHIITSTVDLSAAEIELINFSKREFILKLSLQRLEHYDRIIIDCPPSLGLLTINALVACESIIIPLQCEFYALEGLAHLLKTLNIINKNLNPSMEILGILLTMYDRRNRLTEEVEKDVRAYLGNKVFDTVIPRNVKVSEAPSHGIPAIIYDHKCSGSQAYAYLAKEIITIEKEYETID